MHSTEVLKAVSTSSGVSYAAIARRLGLKPSYIPGTIARGSDPSAGNVARMLGACGWRLCALPADAVPPSALVIGDDADDAERIKSARRAELERRALELENDLERVRLELDTLD